MNLHDIANKPGFGTGKVVRDRLAAEQAIRSKLPKPSDLPPIWADTEIGFALPVCHLGNSSDDGKDWMIVGEPSDVFEALFQDAKTDAEVVSAIVNAYRLGILTLNGGTQE